MMATFLFEYEFEGATFGFTIEAETQDRALWRLSAMQYATVLGEMQAAIPYEAVSSHPDWLPGRTKQPAYKADQAARNARARAVLRVVSGDDA
jgi:hypothetical protein